MRISMRQAVVGAFALVSLSAVPASAQWSATTVGVAEYDTNETLLLLAGLSAGPGGPGWSPILGIQGYRLSYQVSGNDNEVWSIRPYAGLRNNFPGGTAAATLGYAFTNRDDGRAIPVGTVVGDRDDGAVVSGQLDFWGSGSPWGYQALASYNFGGESLWARGRATRRIRETMTGAVRLGGEVAFLVGSGYNAIQPGGVIEWHAGEGRILGFGAGRKIVSEGDDATYFKLEAVLPILR